MVAPPPLPAVPSTTPTWLIHGVALIVALCGPVLAWVDPTGKIDTPTAQAVVILGFLVVAAIIFTVTIAIEAVHKYGLSKAAFQSAESSEVSELKVLLPEFRATYAEAKPGLALLPGITTTISAVSKQAAAAEAKVDAVPAVQRDAILAAINELDPSILASALAGKLGIQAPAPTPAAASAAPIATGEVAGTP